MKSISNASTQVQPATQVQHDKNIKEIASQPVCPYFGEGVDLSLSTPKIAEWFEGAWGQHHGDNEITRSKDNRFIPSHSGKYAANTPAVFVEGTPLCLDVSLIGRCTLQRGRR
jgi:hypothetical protein